MSPELVTTAIAVDGSTVDGLAFERTATGVRATCTAKATLEAGVRVELRLEPTDDPGWLIPGLTGAGAVLAAGLLTALRRRQRTQLRYRKPGDIVVPPPAPLNDLEKTLHVEGSSMAWASLVARWAWSCRLATS